MEIRQSQVCYSHEMSLNIIQIRELIEALVY